MMEIGQFCGMRLIANPVLNEFKPKLQLINDVPCTDTFRSEFNNYLLNLFGKERNVYMLNGSIFAHPNNIEFIKRQARLNEAK